VAPADTIPTTSELDALTIDTSSGTAVLLPVHEHVTVYAVSAKPGTSTIVGSVQAPLSPLVVHIVIGDATFVAAARTVTIPEPDGVIAPEILPVWSIVLAVYVNVVATEPLSTYVHDAPDVV